MSTSSPVPHDAGSGPDVFEATSSRRILLATVPLAGHTFPVVPIAVELARRGHEVVWYTGREFASVVERTGVIFEPIDAGYDPIDGGLDERFPQRAGLRGLAGIQFDLKHVFLDAAPGQLADLGNILRRFPADVLVVDAGVVAAPMLHERGGPVWASIGITPLPFPSRDTAPFGTGLHPARTIVGRIAHRAIATVVERRVLRDVEDYHRGVRSSLGLPPPCVPVLQSVLSPYLYLHSGTASFEYPRRDLPAHVHFIGPLFPGTDTTSAPIADWAELARQRPVVVVTQGTLADAPDQLIEPTLTALADRDIHVIVAGHEVLGRSIPANARFHSFIPFAEILPHATLMITNGGYGGIQHALAYGVPLVVAGRTEDKPETAARVSWSGVGIDLRTATPTARKIRRAVDRVLNTESYTRHARRLRDDIVRHQPARTASDLIEQLARTGETVAAPGAGSSALA